MNKTPIYKLKKPTFDDFGDITDLNENADIIDAYFKANDDALKAHYEAENPHKVTPEQIGAVREASFDEFKDSTAESISRLKENDNHLEALVSGQKAEALDLFVQKDVFAEVVSGHFPPNALDNAEAPFINQVGQSVYPAGFTVNIADRWQVWNLNAEVLPNGLRLTRSGGSSAWLRQRIENPEQFHRGKWIFSIRTAVGDIYSLPIDLKGAGAPIVTTPFGTLSFASDSNAAEVYVHINDGQSIVIDGMELIPSNMSTLAYRPPEAPQAKMARCQRHYLVQRCELQVVSVSNASPQLYLHEIPPMRTVPMLSWLIQPFLFNINADNLNIIATAPVGGTPSAIRVSYTPTNAMTNTSYQGSIICDARL